MRVNADALAVFAFLFMGPSIPNWAPAAPSQLDGGQLGEPSMVVYLKGPAPDAAVKYIVLLGTLCPFVRNQLEHALSAFVQHTGAKGQGPRVAHVTRCVVDVDPRDVPHCMGRCTVDLLNDGVAQGERAHKELAVAWDLAWPVWLLNVVPSQVQQQMELVAPARCCLMLLQRTPLHVVQSVVRRGWHRVMPAVATELLPEALVS
eukprot:scaffold6735_cov59-Phaeocystis_antarctica.AAC.2